LDPTGFDSLFRWLAYGHPIWMVTSLALVVAALRAGLGLRRARLAGLSLRLVPLRRHVRLGKVAVAFVVVGFGAGPISMALLRGREPFGTSHAVAGSLAAALFVAVAFLGRRLETGRGRPIDAHRTLALLAVLVAAAAFATGFILLP
jgi:hypothetical protein